MDVNAKYDLTEIHEFFTSWYSPQELINILRRFALNATTAYLAADDYSRYYDLKEDLEDLCNFITSLEKVNRVN